jgi:hypothetical protein
MQINHPRFVILVGLFALAGCGDVVPHAESSQPARPTASRVPATPPPPPPRAYAPPPRPLPPRPAAAPAQSDWRDATLPAGDWTWQARPGGSVARYGPAGATPLAMLVCERGTGTLSLAVPATAQATTTTHPATIATSTSTGTFVARTTVIDGQDTIAITLPATDRIFDAMAFSRGRFDIEITGFSGLVLPSWAEVGRVVEDCRG